ncbi:MAG: ArsR family transcriptional regulator [Thermoprotei archaeon]|nr:MAG: ArsR family transcriptional regulator [Thermoprotei archaeon]RLF17534.1 MAG: ArsR family transcriptional regulator [Thermoprotei archaeon]
MSIEEVLSSKGRVKVLKVLLKSLELNISEVVRRSGLNYTAVASHIDALKEAGLLEEKTFGRIRILRVKLEDPRVQALRKLFDLFEVYGGKAS